MKEAFRLNSFYAGRKRRAYLMNEGFRCNSFYPVENDGPIQFNSIQKTLIIPQGAILLWSWRALSYEPSVWLQFVLCR